MAATPPAGDGAAVAIERPRVSGQPFAFSQEHLEYHTEHGPCFRDITDDVRLIVQRSGIQYGQVAIFSQHTTAAIRLQENEPLLIEDMCALLRRIAPPDAEYRHNDFSIRTVNMNPNESPNGHSHCQHLFLSSSETVPLVEGNLVLGRYQSIFLVELDGARPRRVTVNILGVTGAV